MEIPSLRISPNPVMQGQTITIGMFNENCDNFCIELVDLQGNLISKRTIENSIVILERVSTDKLSKGAYILKVISDRFSAIRHIIIK